MLKDDILFASLGMPQIDKAQALFEIENVENNGWFYDPVGRGCTSVILFGQKDETGEIVPEWISNAPKTIKEYFEQEVFTWMPHTRIALIKSPPGHHMPPHMDCAPEFYNMRQHKFRIVLQGRVDSLYFVTQQGPVWIPEVDKPFIIDGSWTHGMLNETDDWKYTICVGAPWGGQELSEYPKIQSAIFNSRYDRPENDDRFYYRGKSTTC